MIEGLEIVGNGSYETLIRIHDTNLHFQISNCYLRQGWTGINLNNVTNGYLSGNVIIDSRTEGIELHNSWNNSLTGNLITKNGWQGILMEFSEYNLLSSNNITNNGNQGMILRDSWNNNLTENFVANNTEKGIILESSGYNLICKNTVSNNELGGISLEFSDNNLLYNNIIANNSIFGISLRFSLMNIGLCNTVANHSEYGISIFNSENTKILYNNFQRNNIRGESQAIDENENVLFVMNYWDSWTSPDVNQDGIVDHFYPIEGNENTFDKYPSVTPVQDGIDFSHILPFHLLSPRGGGILFGSIMIRWTPGVDVSNHSVTYSISYSADNGSSWVTLASNLTSQFFMWDSTTVADSYQYLIRVNASCNGGFWCVVTLTTVFTIDNVPTIPSLLQTYITNSSHQLDPAIPLQLFSQILSVISVLLFIVITVIMVRSRQVV
jgi:parallel beta-helix repeat protein